MPAALLPRGKLSAFSGSTTVPYCLPSCLTHGVSYMCLIHRHKSCSGSTPVHFCYFTPSTLLQPKDYLAHICLHGIRPKCCTFYMWQCGTPHGGHRCQRMDLRRWRGRQAASGWMLAVRCPSVAGHVHREGRAQEALRTPRRSACRPCSCVNSDQTCHTPHRFTISPSSLCT